MINERDISKRTSEEEYIQWHQDEFEQVLNGGQPAQWYKQVTDAGRADLERSEFWKELLICLPFWNRAFKLTHNNHGLLVSDQPPIIGIKDFESAVNKSYRKNQIENKGWSDAPPEDPPTRAAAEALKADPEAIRNNPMDVRFWYGPHNWLTDFPDVFRVRLVVSYFDGVKYLAGLVEELAKRTTQHLPQSRLRAQQDGYHAAHILVCHELTIDDFQTRQFLPAPVNLEIQITTDIQEKIITMLHNVYKEWREQGPPLDWQWDHESTAFAINYLGSTLHYLEGMMVRARDIDGGGPDGS